jgi:uncharacterized membrane protein
MSLLQILALLAYLTCLWLTVRRLSFSAFFNDKKIQHLVFGSAASLFFLWIFRAGIYPGLNVHFLWLTALALLLGLRFAIVSSFLALLGMTLIGKESWAMLGVNGMLGVLAPLCVSYLIYILSFYKLPRHVFVYIFVCAFIPGAAMIAMKMALLSGYYFLNGDYDWLTIQDNYLILTTLMLFPEGMLNGMTMTLFIIYKPQWVYTFHDKYYLKDK